jgi:hypothetical protein
MAIKINRYVDITSGVGGAAVATQRDLVLRAFTDNERLPPRSFISFSDSDAVGNYFGFQADEYFASLFYFSWISKSITSPPSIQFARWVELPAAPQIFGIKNLAPSLTPWSSVTSGALVLTMGAFTYPITGLNFTAAADLNAVASIVETAIRAQVPGGTLFTNATVSFNPTTASFDLVGGDTGDLAISVEAGTGTDITVAGFLGWRPASVNTNGAVTSGAIWCPGSDAQTITECLQESSSESDNFGSFIFMPSLDLDIIKVKLAAQWNQEQNNKYLYSVAVDEANASLWSTELDGISGVSLTLNKNQDEYPELDPTMILAATDYDRINSVQNYMFQVFPGLTPSVTTDAEADAYDALKINYYGQTQTAGTKIEFYQRGSLMDGLAMNVYANEIWLKDAAVVAIANLLIAQTRVPANTTGRAMLINTLQPVVQQALNNGVISVGKTLTDSQKNFITQVTGDEYAWYQVQYSGYWLDAVIVFVSPNNYEARYTLVYSKDDVINFVSGTHILV